jgi:nitroreductase
MTTHPKHATSDHDILDLIRQRWSPRAFDPSKPIADGDLRSLFEAARWAPSSYNEQPWRFVVADRHKTPEAFRALHATLKENNRSWAGLAPVLVLVAASTHLERFSALNQHAWYDAGQAIAFLSLQATHLGIGVRQMEGFDRDAVRKAFAVPDNFDPVIVMAIGYLGDSSALEIERHRLAEQAPRERRSIGSSVYSGTWGHPKDQT